MQKLKDNKIILISILIFILLSIIRIFSAPLIAGDEFINYYNTLKIFNGEKMWADVNIITTPFIYLVGCLFFKILGTNFIVYRIYNLIINILFFITLFITFKNLNINKKSSLIYTLILEIEIISYVSLWGITYNIVAMLFCIIGVNLNIKKSSLKNYNIYQGLIMFLILFTKHNIGLYYIFAQILIEIITEKNWKKITNLIKQSVIPLVGMGIFVLVIWKNDLLNPFLDMTLGGVGNFTSNLKISIIPLIISLSIIIFLAILFFMKYHDKNNKNNFIVLSILGIMMLFMAFPIADTWHIILASTILYIELIYILDLNEIKIINNSFLIGIDCYLILFILLNFFYNINNIKKDLVEFELDKKSKFYLTFVEQAGKIKKVGKYITDLDKKVVIVSPEAGIYNLQFELQSNGFFDEPFNGNLGSNQLKKMKEKLNEYEDYYIFIHTEKKYLQEVDEFRNYIKENYEKINEIEGFSVYKK